MINRFFVVFWYEVAQSYRYVCFTFSNNCNVRNIDEFMDYLFVNFCSSNFSVIYVKQVFTVDEENDEFQKAEQLYR